MSKTMFLIVSDDVATPIAKAAAATEMIHGAVDFGVISCGILLWYLGHLRQIQDLLNILKQKNWDWASQEYPIPWMRGDPESLF